MFCFLQLTSLSVCVSICLCIMNYGWHSMHSFPPWFDKTAAIYQNRHICTNYFCKFGHQNQLMLSTTSQTILVVDIHADTWNKQFTATQSHSQLLYVPSCSCVRSTLKHGSLMMWQNNSNSMFERVDCTSVCTVQLLTWRTNMDKTIFTHLVVEFHRRAWMDIVLFTENMTRAWNN